MVWSETCPARQSYGRRPSCNHRLRQERPSSSPTFRCPQHRTRRLNTTPAPSLERDMHDIGVSVWAPQDRTVLSVVHTSKHVAGSGSSCCTGATFSAQTEPASQEHQSQRSPDGTALPLSSSGSTQTSDFNRPPPTPCARAPQ